MRLAPSSVETSQEQLLGDLNGNGVPDVADAIGTLRIVVGLDPTASLADRDQDGVVGVVDAITVWRCVTSFAPRPVAAPFQASSASATAW